MGEAAKGVVPVANLREFFRDSVHGALVKQHVAVNEQTEQYVVNVLTLFARSEALYEQTPQGVRLKPLASHLVQNVNQGRSPSHSFKHSDLKVKCEYVQRSLDWS